jgi:hypothetical protein
LRNVTVWNQKSSAQQKQWLLNWSECSQNEKKIFASYISDKGLITRIYRDLKKLNSQKLNDPLQKWANELKRAFSKEEVQMAKSTWKNAQHPDQERKTLRLDLTPLRMTTTKNTNNNKCWWGCGEKRTLMYCWWECKLVQSLWKNSMEAPYKSKTKIAIWSSKHTHVYYSIIHKLNHENSQDTLPLVNRLRECDIYMQQNFIQPQRKMNFANFIT